MSHSKNVKLLYKTILKLHRGLPEELSILGTKYVREEFQRHKQCDPATAVVFMTSWTEYALTLAKQLGLKGPKTASKIGIDIGPDLLEKMREDQVVQLYELMQAATAPKSTDGSQAV